MSSTTLSTRNAGSARPRDDGLSCQTRTGSTRQREVKKMDGKLCVTTRGTCRTHVAAGGKWPWSAGPRRSARIDHFRSPKVTHTKNTICRWARKMASDIITRRRAVWCSIIKRRSLEVIVEHRQFECGQRVRYAHSSSRSGTSSIRSKFPSQTGSDRKSAEHGCNLLESYIFLYRNWVE
jgi:hypothetical protein